MTGIRRGVIAAVWLAGFSAFAAAAAPEPFSTTVRFNGQWRRSWDLEQGQAFELRVHINDPELLPANARIEVRWQGPDLTDLAFEGERGDLHARATSNWQKTLHALDPDVYLVYLAPKTGTYRIEMETILDRPQPRGDIPRDTGLAHLATALPDRTPAVENIAIAVELRPIEQTHRGDILLETEPNDTPEQAVRLPFAAGDADQVLRVFGGADELEYFNNTSAGKSPDDWYLIEYQGTKPKIFTANLQLVEPTVSARLRVYQPGEPGPEDLNPRELPSRKDFGNDNPIPYVHPPAEVIPGPTPIFTYYEGRDLNERIHQQDTNFRSFTTRKVEPGGVYYLRVEANQPGYELEVRLIDPAPYSDPVRATEQAIYYHLAEVDAWLIHRPRNIALDRRVRDGTSLFGENCMSCHTQSGVWGVADAFRNGYRPEGTVQNWRRLVNTMYESLRPSVKLKDAAVNTSLAPNDLGDAPAGSRVAGRNIVLHERTVRPKRLHSYQQRRTANYVLQTADPKGINAAGKGSNFGPNVVFKFAAEILERAWRDTNDPRYFFGLEEKARKIVAIGNDGMKVSDDLGHRIEFFYHLWPKDYPQVVGRLTGSAERVARAEKFQQEFAAQVETDLQRLAALQQEDGGWGFDLGTTKDDGRSWTRLTEPADPAPTAVALIALEAAGFGADDPRVQRATKWLLDDQFEYGLWNHAAQTGFVTTAYVIRALSRLYPKQAEEIRRLQPREGEQRLETLSRVRRLQAAGNESVADLLIAPADSPHPQVRYQALLGLGGALAADGVPTLVRHLDDPVKMCREAALWSLRQLLLDDTGWQEVFAAYAGGSARARQSILQALVTRADLAGPRSRVDLTELARLLTAAMSDRFAGVRAYAFKAAWRWWVWNPPLREAINRAWGDALLREEPSALAEMALRYSTASMLIVNGQIANQTGGKNADQQYPELSDFYELLTELRDNAGEPRRVRFDQRLTAVAATHFRERANDGGPGQLGYSTPGSADFLGKVVLATYEREDAAATLPGNVPWRKIALQGAANIAYAPLETRLLELLTADDIDMVAVAARALVNPQSLSLPARVDTLRELLDKLDRFLQAGRADDADALTRFLSRIKWDFERVSEREEQEFYRLLISGQPRGRPSRRGSPAASVGGLAGKPAPGEPAENAEEPEQRPVLTGRILGENPTLHRKTAFELVDQNERFWLPSTEWMVSYQEGGLSMEEAVEGAVEAEDLQVLELTFGRTTEQIVLDGLASKNSILWWREGVPGARLTLALDVPEAGPYEILTAFLYDREMGTVQFALNGKDISEPVDFYKPHLTPSGPASLGVHEFEQGENRFTVKMLGANEDAEPLYIFGIDYVKTIPDEGTGSLFTKDERGVDVIDPITAAKDRIIRMFNTWFASDRTEEARELAVNLANKTALRRNPEVRKALAAYVEHETIPRLQKRIQNILNSDDKVYGEQLRKLISEQGPPQGTDARRLEPTSEFIDDILHFRDYVFAEMTKIASDDGKACISCHGVPGRVPTLYLEPPDAAGYIPPDKLLDNYRKMQQRVDLREQERSKFLRKPLNVQTGEEDGHQGGQRFEADDAGYQVIRRWVLKQTELQRGGG